MQRQKSSDKSPQNWPEHWNQMRAKPKEDRSWKEEYEVQKKFWRKSFKANHYCQNQNSCTPSKNWKEERIILSILENWCGQTQRAKGVTGLWWYEAKTNINISNNQNNNNKNKNDNNRATASYNAMVLIPPADSENRKTRVLGRFSRAGQRVEAKVSFFWATLIIMWTKSTK